MKFDEVYDEYADTVYSFLRFRLRDVHLAEDIFQDTFVAVHANLERLATVDSPKAWILTIARRKMIDRLRQIRQEEVLDRQDQMRVSVISPEQRIVEQLDLDHMLDRLDDVSKIIIYGLYVERLTCKELADMLELPEGTVKSKSYAARQKMKRWFERGDRQDG